MLQMQKFTIKKSNNKNYSKIHLQIILIYFFIHLTQTKKIHFTKVFILTNLSNLRWSKNVCLNFFFSLLFLVKMTQMILLESTVRLDFYQNLLLWHSPSSKQNCRESMEIKIEWVKTRKLKFNANCKFCFFRACFLHKELFFFWD